MRKNVVAAGLAAAVLLGNACAFYHVKKMDPKVLAGTGPKGQIVGIRTAGESFAFPEDQPAVVRNGMVLGYVHMGCLLDPVDIVDISPGRLGPNVVLRDGTRFQSPDSRPEGDVISCEAVRTVCVPVDEVVGVDVRKLNGLASVLGTLAGAALFVAAVALDDDGERRRLGITEKGIAPLESLVFAKYMMFRHIYWHHAARIASAMFTRYVQDAVDAGVVNPEEFYRLSDDVLIESLPSDPRSVSSADLMARLRTRELYKRGFTLFPEHPAGEEEFTLSGHEMERVKDLYRRPELRREKEIAVCRLLNDLQGFELSGFEVLLDIPRLSSVFDLADFRDLRVLVSPRAGSGGRFVPFNSFGFTLLTADFAQEFERYSRRLQVICRPDLREAVRTLWREITALVVA